MPAATLVGLPSEVLLVVAGFLTDAGINAFTQTSRRFHDALDHSLYVLNARERNCCALQWAAQRGVIGTVRKALAAGADPNSRRRSYGNPHPDNFAIDIYDSTPLMYISFSTPLTLAAKSGRLDIATALIEAGASVEGSLGNSPLIAAVQEDHLSMMKLLIASGKINLDSATILPNDYNWLGLAAHHAGIEVVRYILDNMKGPDDSIASITPLISAIKRFSVAMVRILLNSAKIDPDEPDLDGQTPFMWAVRLAGEDETIVQLLLDSEKVNVNATDDEGQTALSLAAGLGKEQMVRRLLAMPSVDPNLAGSEGMRPVARALGAGEMSIVRLLMASDKVQAHIGTLFRLACELKSTCMIKELLKLDSGERSNTDAKESTWLHTAAIYGCTDTVKTLLQEQLIDINHQRLDGATPLLCALQEKRKATTSALLQAGADVNLATTDGRSALFFAAERSSHSLSEELLKRGSDVGAVTETGDTALHHACKNGMHNVVQVLLNYGADPVRRANHGGTPLHAACASRWERTVRILLGAIPHSHPILRTGRTPLHDACQAGHTGIARQLLDHGADPLARLDNGVTPLEYACKGFPIIAKLLLEMGADPSQTCLAGVSLLYLACTNTTPKVAALLLQYGADPNVVEVDGMTPFFRACGRGHLLLIRTLLKYGGDVTWTRQDGCTALHEVCSGNNVVHGGQEAWDLLIVTMLGMGVDVNARMQNGRTPLHVACVHRWDLMPVLVRAGADPLAEYTDVRTSRRKTPIHMACSYPKATLELATFLQSSLRVPVGEFFKSGWTPLHEAAAAAHPEAVALLLAHGMNPMALAENGRTALHEAIIAPNSSLRSVSKVVIALMETGKMDINHRDNDGRTALGLVVDMPESLRILMVKWGAKQ